MPALILRRAFSDVHGLSQLGAGVVPSIEETRRRIFVVERRSGTGRPDHFYKGYLADRLGELTHVGEIAPEVLARLAERYLERRAGRLVVRHEVFGEWHELLPFISPLAVIVAFLVAEDRGPRPGDDPRTWLAEEIGESALLGPFDRGLDDLVEREGLHELHMHLNGSTELDVLWPEAVTAPLPFYRALREEWTANGEPVRELYEQMEPGLDPYAIYKRLRAARRIRRQMALELAAAPPPLRADGRSAIGMDALLEAAAFETTDADWTKPPGEPLAVHPARVLFAGENCAPIIEEAAFLYAALQALGRDPGQEALGVGLYFNLLTLAQIGRLSVQQVDETGFDQFQKYTFVGTRARIEKRYAARFRQLNGRAPYDVLAHLEGRFAPKDSIPKTRALIETIVEDYLEFRGCRSAKGARALAGVPPPCLLGRPCRADASAGAEPCARTGRPESELALVAHFIKRTRKVGRDRAHRCRDSQLRLVLRQQARVLAELVRSNLTVRALLRGVDGASNELHAPPEPFAPSFRHARAVGIPHATFHVGEDFRHLVSGIRAVVEAVTFLDLGAGDRVGHATALGIDPGLWLARSAPRLMMHRLDALDDAVFAHRALSRVGGFERERARLEERVAMHSARLYGRELSPVALEAAWGLRTLDALEVRAVESRLPAIGTPADARAVADGARFLAETAVDPVRARELSLIAKSIEGAGGAYPIFSERHAMPADVSDGTVEVEADYLPIDALVALQEHGLALLRDRAVVIETLPTSNLRISFYDTLSEHHVFRWLGLAEPMLRNRPQVVVGSDDPGIFATNLRNEYAALGAALRDGQGRTPAEALEQLGLLGKAGRIARFRPGGI